MLSWTVLTAPAQAAPDVGVVPVATTELDYVNITQVRYYWAGVSGFEYALGDVGNSHWFDYPGVTPPDHAGPDDPSTGTDVTVDSRTDTTVTLKHRATGVTASVTLPAGQTYAWAVGWSVVSKDADGALHVLYPAAGGSTSDTPVTGFPAGARIGSYLPGGSVRRLAVLYTPDGGTEQSMGLIDLTDGSFRSYFSRIGSSLDYEPNVAFNDRWVVADNRVLRVDAAPGTDPVVISEMARPLAVVGDQLMSGDPDFVSSPDDEKVTAISLTTGARRTVLTQSFGSYGATLDGGLLAPAGTSGIDWHVYRFLPTADGDVSDAEEVFTLPRVKAEVDALMMAGGELLMYGNATNPGSYAAFAVPLDTDGRPTGDQARRGPWLSHASCLSGDAACPQVRALGDGRYARVFEGADGKDLLNVAGPTDAYDAIANVATGDSSGRIGSGTGRYVLYNGGSAGVQKVADFPGAASGQITLDRPRTAAAVWGQRLWTPGSTQGTVVAYDLKTQKNVATVTTGAPCTPSEIQAVDTWLYWTCGAQGPAGVYDRAAGRAITVPAGQAALADGYLVRENRTTHELLFTDFHTGTAVTQTVAVLPSTDQDTGGDTGRWTVDRFGGNLAYLTDTGRVAILTAGVPTSPLAQMEAQTDPVSGPTTASPWQPVWQLSKPSKWTLNLLDSSGTVVRTLTGSSTAAAVRASWDGLRSDGRHVAGSYLWELTAHPGDGQGPDLTLTGTTTVH